jgi:radical SAM superfamily enzyme YgiQ (UPF0313 family)
MGANRFLSPSVYDVWPPVWNAFDPHVAVPALCGFLAGQGLQVRQFDLNIDFFRYLTDEKTIGEQVELNQGALPRTVQEAAAFARQYYHISREPLLPGYMQRFSDDAERQLLSRALTIFNHFHRESIVSTLGVYHQGDAEDSDFVAEFSARDKGNAFAPFFRTSLIREVERELPAIVGISVCGPFQLTAALTLARLIKETEARICVVIGGAFFSSLPGVLLNAKTSANLFRHVDAFILNEGEMPFLQLIRDVFSGSPPQPAANVVLRQDRELRYEPMQCLPADQLAVPLFEEAAVESYFRPAPRLPVEVSRGCYWGRCTFCNLASGANERYRAVPTENIARAISSLVDRHGTRTIVLSSLAAAPKILRTLSAWLLAHDMHVSWSGWIRPEKSLTKSDFELFRRAGCSSLSVTPESFNDATLCRMDKGVRREELVRLLGDLMEVGLCDGINLIPGFPGETLENFLETLDVCRTIGLQGEFFPFCLLRNSAVYKHPESFGVVLHEQTRKDLAVSVPYDSTLKPASPSGLDLIRMAAQLYPRNIFADNPLAGYTFDFSFARPSMLPSGDSAV